MAQIDLSKEENAVRQIQEMLRRIRHHQTGNADIAVSGNYDKATENAVREFQGQYGLPVNGIVDYTTWRALVAVTERILRETLTPRPVHIFPKGEKYELRPGTEDDLLYVIQIMLNALSVAYNEIQPEVPNGKFDRRTEEAIKAVQRKRLLPQTGIIDAKTWNALADSYEALNRSQ